MDNRTEQLADGVWRIEAALFVNAYLLANDGRGDDAGLTLVDTGTPAAGPRLVRSVRMAGLDPRAIDDVLLTHWHADHAGSAARFAASSATPRVHAGAADAPIVAGTVPPFATAGARPTLAVATRRRVMRPPAPVDDVAALAVGERLDLAGGLEVVDASGHTPGSLAFWLPARGVLLAGDAVCCLPRVWRGPKALCADRDDAQATLRRLADLPVEVVAAGHGVPVLRAGADRLAALTDRGRG